MRSLQRFSYAVMAHVSLRMCVGATLLLLGAHATVWAQDSPVFSPRLTEARVASVPAGLTPPAWNAMRAAIEEDQYGLRRERDRYRAVNQAHRLDVTFTREGVEVTPRAGEGTWRWGLRLTGYGYGTQQTKAAQPERVVTGNRIEYRRGDLVEWYVNERRGVEQGFTVSRPPEKGRGDAPLILYLGATGDLRPSITQDGQGIAWRDALGTTALWYRGLKVWDATGRTLEARMEAVEGGFGLRVDDEGATYPLTIDPLIQQVKLIASDAVPLAQFGWSVAVSGDTAIVGAPQGAANGAAYIFVRDGGSANAWSQLVKLTPGAPTTNDQFGGSVAISGDTAIIGAAGDDTVGVLSGAAYIFARNHGGPNAWGEVVKLIASDATTLSEFGASVAIWGDAAIVGAPRGYFPDVVTGSAYIFARQPGGANQWGEVAKVSPSDGGLFELFGWSVAINGNTAIVGAPRDSDHGFLSGAAYIFAHDLTTNTWNEMMKLTASDAAARDNFGECVAISSNTIVIGAPGDDDHADGSGAAYIFGPDPGGTNAWGEVVKLTASDAAAKRLFGESVAIAGDMAIVGSPRHTLDEASDGPGAAYAFARHQGAANAWGEVMKLRGDTAGLSFSTSTDFFGPVSISGHTVFVGAPFDEGAGGLSGAAYAFAVDKFVPVVNQLVSLSVENTSCCTGVEFIVTATLANTSGTPIARPSLEVIELTGGNVLKNADGAPGGVGATLTPDVGDGVLSPGESTTVTFVIGLRTRQPFQFLLNVRGEPVSREASLRR